VKTRRSPWPDAVIRVHDDGAVRRLRAPYLDAVEQGGPDAPPADLQHRLELERKVVEANHVADALAERPALSAPAIVKQISRRRKRFAERARGEERAAAQKLLAAVAELRTQVEEFEVAFSKAQQGRFCEGEFGEIQAADYVLSWYDPTGTLPRPRRRRR
jgi:hypothetical protein